MTSNYLRDQAKLKDEYKVGAVADYPKVVRNPALYR